MRNSKPIMIIFLAVLLSTGCEKYSDGGLISKADENLQNSWQLISYSRNGNNETSQLFISGYSEEYTPGGTYSRTYINKDGELVSETGHWELAGDQRTIHISDVSSIEYFSENNTTISSSTYLISKLKKDEYWYHYENGGDVHLFKFVLK